MTAEPGPDMRISIEVGDADSISPRLHDALTELAAALADEEVPITEELAEELAASDDVHGFQFGGALKLGDIGGGAISPMRTEFCGSYQIYGGMGDCTLYGKEEGDPPVANCRLRFW